MKTVYRERTISEQMDYELSGDRPIAHFLLNQQEYDRFVEERTFTFSTGSEPYMTYKNIRIVKE